MVRSELQDASERLESAAASCGDDEASERLIGLAEQLEGLATAERGPDHGRLARIQSALSEIEADVDDDTRAEIDEADDRIDEFRETLEGV